MLMPVVNKADVLNQAAAWSRASRTVVPEVTVVPIDVGGGNYYFLPAVNGYRANFSTPNAAANGKVNSDLSVIVEDVPPNTRHTFESVTYPSVTAYPDGGYSTGSVSLAATGTTVTLRCEFRRMSPRVVRRRVFLKATVATTARVTCGIMGDTTNMAALKFDDHNLTSVSGNRLAAQVLCGVALSSAAGTANAGVGVGMCDPWQCRRHIGDANDKALKSIPDVTGGCAAFVGDNNGLPAYPVGTAETYFDLFYWSAQWRDEVSRHREMALAYADALGIPDGGDDLLRLAAAAPVACKGASTRGGNTPHLMYDPGQNPTFPRDSFWAQMAFRDHAFSAALLNRFATNLSTLVVNGVANVAPDNIDDAGAAVYRLANDSNPLALLWAYWLASRATVDTNSATSNGLTDAIRNNLTAALIALDNSGNLVFTRGTYGAGFGHYDWYSLPAGSFAHYSGAQMTGYYACAMAAAYRLGYDDGNMVTRIAAATAAYQGWYDATLGHLRFAKDTDSGTYLTYGSLIDLFPEWHAVFVLGMPNGLLGATITKACVNYFMARHLITLVKPDGSFGGRALKLMMQDGGIAYVPAAEMNNGLILPGTYVNGGSQFPFDFVLASLGQYYGVPGMRQFWADRKLAETFTGFDLNEALCLVNPSPDPVNDPYGGRLANKNMAWHGLVAAFEASSGLVG